MARGPNKFEDLHSEYTIFVRELHEKLGTINRKAAYVAGSNFLNIMGWVLVVLGLFGFVLRWGFGLRGTLPRAYSAALGLPIILLGRAKHYDPGAIPTKYLP